MSQVVSTYYKTFLAGIPIVMIFAFLCKDQTLMIDGEPLGMSFLVIGGLFSAVLGFKAFLYWKARELPLAKYLSKFDILFSQVLMLSVFYIALFGSGEIAFREGIGLNLMIAFVFWVLLQLFVFVNFYTHMMMNVDIKK